MPMGSRHTRDPPCERSQLHAAPLLHASSQVDQPNSRRSGGRGRVDSAREPGGAESGGVDRLPLPPHELRPARSDAEAVPPADRATASAAWRCSAFRCSRSGSTRSPATTRRPTTSTPTRRSTTTRSPTRTSRWSIGRSRPREQARFDPMITGFNPARHVRRRSHPARAADLSRRVHRDRRVHDPQGIRLGQGAPRPGESARPGARQRAGARRARSGWSRSSTTTWTCRSRPTPPSRRTSTR